MHLIALAALPLPPPLSRTTRPPLSSTSSPSFSSKYASEAQEFSFMENATMHGTGIWVSRGFEYVKSRLSGDTHYLQCRYFRKGCRGRAKIDLVNNQFFELSGDHICQFK